MPSISQLTGALKQPTDISSQSVKIRYTEANSVVGSANRKIILRFPKIENQMLDLSSITLDFSVDLNTDAYFDVPDYNAVIQRVRVLSSSNVILDISDYNLLQSQLNHGKTQSTENSHSRNVKGLFDTVAEAKAASATTQRCSLKFPENTILNTSGLLPLSKITGSLTCEIYLEDPKKILGSATNDQISAFTLSDIQLNCTYISSQSLTNYYQNNGTEFHVENWSHRFQNVNDQKSILRVPSSFKSLCKLLVCIRSQAKVDGIDLSVANRMCSNIAYTDLASIQWFSNNTPLYSEPFELANIETELWNETLKTYSALNFSTYHTDVTTGKTVNSPGFWVNLQSAPQQFHDELLSGLASNQHVSSIYSQITFAVTPTNYSATVFTMNNSRVFVDGNGSLQMEM
jgi:hypothetical protein